MPGWLRSVGSGPSTWMLSNATSTAWINPHQRKGRQGEDDAAQTANVTKEKRDENQSDQHIRGRPGQGPALLYGGRQLEARNVSIAAQAADRTSSKTFSGRCLSTLTIQDACDDIVEVERRSEEHTSELQ